MGNIELPDPSRMIHYLENNKFSQKQVDKNRDKLTGQLLKVLWALTKGMKLCDDTAREIFKIRHLARRIGDIGEMMNIYVDREWMMDEDGEQTSIMVYFLPDNRGMFIRKGYIINRPWRWWYSNKFTDAKIIRAIELEKRKREAERAKTK